MERPGVARICDQDFDRFMEEYCLENNLGAEWLDRLPLFLKVLEMELFSHYVQYT